MEENNQSVSLLQEYILENQQLREELSKAQLFARELNIDDNEDVNVRRTIFKLSNMNITGEKGSQIDEDFDLLQLSAEEEKKISKKGIAPDTPAQLCVLDREAVYSFIRNYVSYVKTYNWNWLQP